MPHSYAMYGYAGYAKFGYATWLRMHRTVTPVTPSVTPNTVTQHDYATYGYAGYAKFGYDTWLRYIRNSVTARHSVTPHHSSHHSRVTPRVTTWSLHRVTPLRHSWRHSLRHSTASLPAPLLAPLPCHSAASLHRITAHVTPRVTLPRQSSRHSPASFLT